MAYSTQTVVSDGTLLLLGVTLDYFERTEIRVLFEDVVVPPEAGLWAWVGSTSKNIQFTPAVSNGVEVKLVRQTDVAEMRHTFSGGSQLRADTLDENFVQLLHVAQEAQEGNGVGAGVLTFNGRDGDVALTVEDITDLGFTPDSGGGPSGVTSFNTRTGAVTLTQGDMNAAAGGLVITNGNAPSQVVTSFNTRKGAVTLTYADVVGGLGYVPSAGTSGVNTWMGRNGNVVMNDTDITTALGGTAVTTATLGATTGAGLSGYSRTGTGAVTRNVGQFIRLSSTTPEDFGAVGDGVTNDTTAFQNALNSLPAGGKLLCTKRYFLQFSVTVPHGITVEGNYEIAGNMSSLGVKRYTTSQSAIIIPPTAAINLLYNSGLKGLLIHREGMTDTETSTSAFAGQAIIPSGDDCFVHGCAILGFAQAYYSSGWQRPDLRGLNIDCLAGIYIGICFDIAYLERIHCWPFVTIGNGGGAVSYQRSGAAFHFKDTGDWNKVTNCFSYAYYRGYIMENVNSMTLLSCSADSTTGFVGQLGFLITGTSHDTRLIGCQAAGQETGYYFGSIATSYASMLACDAWVSTNNSVVVASGDVSIFQGDLRNSTSGVVVTSAASTVTIADVRFRDVAGAAIANIGGASPVYIRNNVYQNVGSTLPDFPAAGGGSPAASAVTFSPTGTISSTNVQAAIAEVATEAVQTATTVSFTPSGTISAINVQAAITEVNNEANTNLAGKAQLNGSNTQNFQAATFVGGFGTFSNIVNPAVETVKIYADDPANKAALLLDGSLITTPYPQAGGKGAFRSNTVTPLVDNAYELGNLAAAWSQIVSWTAVQVISDRRTKTEIEDSKLGLPFIQSLRPVQFKYKVGAVEPDDAGSGNLVHRAGKRTHYGFIAQEVKEALGDRDAAIWVSADPDDPEAKQLLRLEEMISPLVAAVQELATRLAAVENKE